MSYIYGSAEEYVNDDNDLAVCVDLDDQKWEENFMDNLVHDTTEEESDVDEEFDISLPSSKIKSYREVIQSLEHSQIFLDSRGCLEAATHASSLINLVPCHHVSNLTQTTLDQYL